MTISTATSHATAPVNVVYQQTLLRLAKPRCPHFVGSMPGEIRSHSGTFSVTWRRIDAMTPTTTALTELSGNISHPTRTATAIAVTDVSATISKYGDFVFLTEELQIVNLADFNSQMDGLVKTLGIQAGRSLNRLQRNVLEDSATLVYTGTATADAQVGDPINAQIIESATNTLENNSAMTFTSETTGSQNSNTFPVGEAFWGICHTHVKPDVRALSGFVAVERYSGQIATAPGEFGKAGDVRWVSSPEASADVDVGGTPGGAVRSTGGAQADLYTSIILGRDAHGTVSLDTTLIQEIYMAGDQIPGIILISKERGSAGSGDPLDEVATLGWKSWHAGTELNDDNYRGIRTAASVLQ